MAKTQSQQVFTKKLDDLRKRLLGDVNLQEMERMRLQIDLLEQAASPELDFHHHDTNEHHDHQTKNITEIEEIAKTNVRTR